MFSNQILINFNNTVYRGEFFFFQIKELRQKIFDDSIKLDSYNEVMQNDSFFAAKLFLTSACTKSIILNLNYFFKKKRGRKKSWDFLFIFYSLFFFACFNIYLFIYLFFFFLLYNLLILIKWSLLVMASKFLVKKKKFLKRNKEKKKKCALILYFSKY